MLGLAFLGVKDLNTLKGKNEKIELSAEQRELLTNLLKDEKLTDRFERLANEELSAQEKLAQNDTQAEELRTLLAEHGVDISAEETPAPVAEGEDSEEGVEGNSPKPKGNSSIAASLRKLLSMKDEEIEALSRTPEPDMAREVVHNKNHMQHSTTHLFSSGNSWDAFANRPWNTRMKQRLAGQEVSAASYSELDYNQLVSDFNAFQKDANRMISFIRGLERIPAHWGRVTGVQNELWYTKLFLGEITQGRKKNWLPKGKFEIQPEKAKVYPTQIDLAFSGYELQQLEVTWAGKYNQEGASPFKVSFIEMLMEYVFKKQAEEDGMAMIKGVYFPTSDDATEAGSFLHRQNGILKLAYNASKDRKYLPFSMGVPTQANIYDYVQEFVGTRLPKYWRSLPGMVLVMDPDLEKAYHKQRELRFGTQPTFEPNKMKVDHYPNVRIETGYGFGNFIYLTTEDNIDALEGEPQERSSMKMQVEKRDTLLLADYKLGTQVWGFGYKWPAGTNMTAEKQIFFSNDQFGLEDVQIPVDPNATVLDATYHFSLQTGVNTGATAITNITNVEDGETVYIYGNSGANPSTIANGGNFDLTGAITLSENAYIKLRKRPSDGKFVELERGDVSIAEAVVLDAGATTADASQGTYFLTSANAGATAFTDIENAVKGVEYRIEGGSDANATTIAASGNFARISASITLENGNYLVVVWNGSVFVEVDRYVA